jgi:hypothetical protein
MGYEFGNNTLPALAAKGIFDGAANQVRYSRMLEAAKIAQAERSLDLQEAQMSHQMDQDVIMNAFKSSEMQLAQRGSVRADNADVRAEKDLTLRTGQEQRLELRDAARQKFEEEQLRLQATTEKRVAEKQRREAEAAAKEATLKQMPIDAEQFKSIAPEERQYWAKSIDKDGTETYSVTDAGRGYYTSKAQAEGGKAGRGEKESTEAAKAQTAARKERAAASQKVVDTLNDRIDTIDKQINDWELAKAKDGVDSKAADAKLKTLNEQRARLDANRQKAQGALDNLLGLNQPEQPRFTAVEASDGSGNYAVMSDDGQTVNLQPSAGGAAVMAMLIDEDQIFTADRLNRRDPGADTPVAQARMNKLKIALQGVRDIVPNFDRLTSENQAAQARAFNLIRLADTKDEDVQARLKNQLAELIQMGQAMPATQEQIDQTNAVAGQQMDAEAQARRQEEEQTADRMAAENFPNTPKGQKIEQVRADREKRLRDAERRAAQDQFRSLEVEYQSKLSKYHPDKDQGTIELTASWNALMQAFREKNGTRSDELNQLMIDINTGKINNAEAFARMHQFAKQLDLTLFPSVLKSAKSKAQENAAQ